MEYTPIPCVTGPIGLVCLLTAKACGAASVIITGESHTLLAPT